MKIIFSKMETSVYIGTSLDGFIARKDGEIEWLEQFADEEAMRSFEEFNTRIDAMVIGRGTFEKVLTFPTWPYHKEVFVLSTSIKQVPDAFKEKVSILSMQPAEVLKFLSDKGYSRIYVDGGNVIQSFLKKDLIDELIVATVPVLIGSGIPLFGLLNHDLPFQHIRTETFSNGLVRSYYKRKK